MKIAIDCRMYGNSGIGTYIREVLPYLISNKKNEYLLIGDFERLKKYNAQNVQILNCKIKIFSLKEFFSFPVKIINKCDIFYTPNYNIPGGIKIPVYSTIHDVVFLDINGIVGKLGRIIRKYFLKRAVEISKKIFTVSEFSKKRIEYYFGSKKKIIVTYNGLSEHIKRYKPKKKESNKEYIIFVGNIKKHKGLKILIEAYNKAKKRGYSKKLVIVGNYLNFKTKDKYVIDMLQTIEKDKDIIFTGYLKNEELLDWISNSKNLIQPSLYEGFGIPPLEALALGVQPIISDIEVFKEIYKALPVIYFKNKSSDSLTEKLIETENLDFNINNKYNKTIEQKYSYTFVATKIIKELK